MIFDYKKLFFYLEARAGQTITIDQIEKDLLQQRYFKKPNISNPPKSKEQDKSFNSEWVFFLEETLYELSNFGLLEAHNFRIKIKKPFLLEANISIARSGAAFGMGDFPEDIFIPPNARKDANQRDKVLLRLINKTRKRFEGEVTQIVSSFSTDFMAKIIENRKNGIYIAELCDLPHKPIIVLKSNNSLKVGSYSAVKALNEEMRILHVVHDKKGKREDSMIVKVFESTDKWHVSHHDADLRRIYLKYNLPQSYPSEAIPSKQSIKDKFESGLKDKTRKDLTHLYSCTIDGATAKDFDDAISLEIVKRKYKLYVHIADVSYFVDIDSSLDKEAYKRSNSYYLSQAVLPMLPPILSEDFCSLNPHTKRLAFTCEMDFDKDGVMTNYIFYKSIIYLTDRYTYHQAEEEIGKFRSKMSKFWVLASLLRKSRFKIGGLELEIPDAEVILNAQKEIKEIRHYEKFRSHQLIEEFMLATNIAAAKLSREHKIPNLYRVHEPMDIEKLESLNKVLGFLGSKHSLKDIEHLSLRKAIKTLKKKEAIRIFNYLLLRSFMQAVYENQPKGHWGLHFPDYTHFTSPIRRYSDLVVHRQIYAYSIQKKLPYNNIQLKEIGKQTSVMERLAMEAERGMMKLLSVRVMEKDLNQVYKSFLTGFNQEGLFVSLDNPPIDGFIPLASFSKHNEINNLDEFRINLDRFQKTVTLGAILTIKLMRVDWEGMRLIFNIEKIES